MLMETCHMLAFVIGPGYPAVKDYLVQPTGRQTNRELKYNEEENREF